MKQSKAYEYEKLAFENEKIKDQLAIKRDKADFIKSVKDSYNEEMDKVYSVNNESKIKRFFKRLFKVL